MLRIGSQLLAESKAANAKRDLDAKSTQARDILSILVRANSTTDLPENQRLSDKDVLARKCLGLVSETIFIPEWLAVYW
jgi:hypothetical protein